MKKRRKRIVVEVLFGVIIFVSFIMSFAWQHESIHQTIYKHFGINSSIEIYPLSAATIPNKTEVENLIKESPNEFYTLEYLQMETEIVGYHLLPIFVVLLCIFFGFVTRDKFINR